jgi:hypothetical protein
MPAFEQRNLYSGLEICMPQILKNGTLVQEEPVVSNTLILGRYGLLPTGAAGAEVEGAYAELFALMRATHAAQTPAAGKDSPRAATIGVENRGGENSAGRIRTYDQPVNSRLLYH